MAILAVWLMPWPFWVIKTSMGWFGVSLILSWRKQAWRCSRHAVTRIDLGRGGEVCVFLADGARKRGRICHGNFVAPFLVILYWQEEGRGRVHYCLVPGDAVLSAEHRLLRVLLRHPL